MKYNEKIQEFYNSDQNIGSFDENDLSIGTGLVGAPACGDVMKLQLKIEKNKIIDAKVLVFGCGSAKASSSYATQEIIGKTLEEALQIKDEDIAKYLGLPSIKYHCSVLAETAIKRAVDDYRKKNNQNIQIKEELEKKESKKCESENEKDLKLKDKQEKEENKKVENDNDFSISISKDAEKHIDKILSKLNKPIIGIRVDLEESSCGLSYKLKYVETPTQIKSNDIIQKTENGLCIFVNNSIAKIINNTTMDYKEEGLKAGIIFNNPNEVGKCGCGSNFKV